MADLLKQIAELSDTKPNTILAFQDAMARLKEIHKLATKNG